MKKTRKNKEKFTEPLLMFSCAVIFSSVYVSFMEFEKNTETAHKNTKRSASREFIGFGYNFLRSQYEKWFYVRFSEKITAG